LVISIYIIGGAMGILSGIMGWFNFKKMLTPFIIKLMYVLGLSFLTFGVIAVFAGMLIAVLGAAGASKSQDAASIIIAALIAFVFSAVIFFLGAFILRIWCEIIIVIFSIHVELVAIEKVLRENR